MAMKCYYRDDRVTIYNGDCITVMAAMPENSIDAIVTDPPYGLEFMGKEWDKLLVSGRHIDYPSCRHSHGPNAYQSGMEAQLFHQQWATEALRVLKPGGHALVAGIGRTHHRTMCGMEDAGFEIRDCVYHLFGSGFPKSTDISKQIDKMAGVNHPAGVPIGSNRAMSGANYSRPKMPVQSEAAKLWEGYGTALKPACEIWVLARKPISEKNIASNVLKWGVGALSIDDCRIGYESENDKSQATPQGRCTGQIYDSMLGRERKDFTRPEQKGRFPANVVLDEEAAAMLGEQSGELPTGSRNGISSKTAFFRTGGRDVNKSWQGDSGGASRFFYVAKPSKVERGAGNTHATVKPIKLMEYLIRLVTREGQIVLDPFGGSMTTVLAAVGIGRKCIAIEKDESYCEIMKGRCRQIAMI